MSPENGLGLDRWSREDDAGGPDETCSTGGAGGTEMEGSAAAAGSAPTGSSFVY